MKYYKVLTKDMTSIYDGKTKWAIGEITKIDNYRHLSLGDRLSLYTKVEYIMSIVFGPRVFEAEPIGPTAYDIGGVIHCGAAKLLRELDPDEVTSNWWIVDYCKYIKDVPKIRKKITKPCWAYCYCNEVKDRPSVRKYITDNEHAFKYCRNIKDRPAVRKYITESEWAAKYCIDVRDKPSMRKLITSGSWQLWYKQRMLEKKYVL